MAKLDVRDASKEIPVYTTSQERTMTIIPAGYNPDGERFSSVKMNAALYHAFPEVAELEQAYSLERNMGETQHSFTGWLRENDGHLYALMEEKEIPIERQDALRKLLEDAWTAEQAYSAAQEIHVSYA